MNAVVELEWTFSPTDYFEEAIEIPRQDYTMTIANGKVQAKIDSATYEANPNMRQELHDDLKSRFLAVQLLTHLAFELSRSKMIRVRPDGRRDIVMDAEPGHYLTRGMPVDSEVIDKDGNVISDSKGDRIEKKKRFSELVSSHYATDKLLPFLLWSYNTAVRDPNNEFVYLYEIREALKAKFSGENAMRSSLGISSSQWSRFGQLCNTLRQGRHRGMTGEALREATEGELTEAREIARAMIEAYLNHLEASNGP